MARTGEVIEHPVSGETMVFLQTAEDTAGELLQIDLFVVPDGAVGAEHVHPSQEERFIIKQGQMTLLVDGRERVLRAGDEATVPPGTPHEWWNSGDVELNAVVEFRPAGRIEWFISTHFGLAKAGQVDPAGVPSTLQAAVTLHEYRDTVQLTDLSPRMQKYVLPVLSLVGKSIGLRADYPYPRGARENRGMEIWRIPEAATS